MAAVRTITLELDLKKQSLGFNIQGGSDSPRAPGDPTVVVSKVLEHGAGFASGLQVGDVIMAIDGTNVLNVLHDRVVELLKASVREGKCTLTIQRVVPISPEPESPTAETHLLAGVTAASSTVDAQPAFALPSSHLLAGVTTASSMVDVQPAPARASSHGGQGTIGRATPDWPQRKMSELGENGEFGCRLTHLLKLISERSHDGTHRLQDQFGGPEGLAGKLRTNLETGIAGTTEDLEARRHTFGANRVPGMRSKTIWELMWDAVQDTTLIVLLIAGVISLILGLTVEEDKQTGWIEGAAIMVSVLIVVLVTSINDLQKERQFKALQAKQDEQKVANVIRGGEKQTISAYDVLVGDLLEVENGFILPADGILLRGHEIECDESALTGESEAIAKDPHHAPFMLSGTSVNSGGGWMIVTCVGLFSQEGIINRLITGAGAEEVERLEQLDREQSEEFGEAVLRAEDTQLEQLQHLPEGKQEEVAKKTSKRKKTRESVLQTKLTVMAMQIGKAGTVVAVLTVLVLFVRFAIIEFGIHDREWDSGYWNDMVGFVIVGVIVLVVAVPEGLPLAVTISLAYSVKKMMTDNNLVRILAACETMGNATTICSDKTGTLTQNRMSVVRAYVSGRVFENIVDIKSLPAPLRLAIAHNSAMNSHPRTDYEIKPDSPYPVQIGNKTECAIQQFADTLCDKPYRAYRQEVEISTQFKFDHRKKRMTTVIKLPNGGHRILVKGAAEIVMKLCTHLDTPEGPRPITPADEEFVARDVIDTFAGLALRVLCLAYRDVPGEVSLDDDTPLAKDLIISCLVGIQDPLRPEVPEAVRVCHRAGVTVRMVTGDNAATARAIAINCGIIPSAPPPRDIRELEPVVMEGSRFASRVLKPDGEINYEEFNQIWPKLRVMARCSPTDKFTLVTGLIHEGEVVAVTGDGTNDGPALAEADVGFAMGSGTAVAKEASDIIILDDNFTSMVKAISWGRNVYDSIAKFLVFQLTVNVVAVTVAFVGACILEESPLKAVQMLWVNLIMDSFASLALATEPPTPELLERKPYPRKQRLLSPIMLRQIIGHGIHQLAIIFMLVWAGDSIYNIPSGRMLGHSAAPTQHYTIVFNTFVWMQIFNEINARKIHDQVNVFKSFFNNSIFTLVLLGTIVGQVIITEFGGRAFKTTSLDVDQWFGCIGLGVTSLIWNVILHYCFPVSLIPNFILRATDDTAAEDSPSPQPEAQPLTHDTDEDRHLEIAPVRHQASTVRRNEALARSWMRGANRLRTQMRVVSAFRSAGHRAALRRRTADLPQRAIGGGAGVPRKLSLMPAGPTHAQSMWQAVISRVRFQLRVVSAFRYRVVARSLAIEHGQPIIARGAGESTPSQSSLRGVPASARATVAPTPVATGTSATTAPAPAAPAAAGTDVPMRKLLLDGDGGSAAASSTDPVTLSEAGRLGSTLPLLGESTM